MGILANSFCPKTPNWVLPNKDAVEGPPKTDDWMLSFISDWGLEKGVNSVFFSDWLFPVFLTLNQLWNSYFFCYVLLFEFIKILDFSVMGWSNGLRES